MDLNSDWTKTHPSATLLQNPEILMYGRTLRFQDFLRLAYGQFFVQSQCFHSGTIYTMNDIYKRIFENIAEVTISGLITDAQ